MPVELQKKFTNDCPQCSEAFETINKDVKYCGACSIAALVIITHMQMLANRWNITINEGRQWIREVARGG